MLKLLAFELKKMLSRRVALAVNIGTVIALVGIMALNVAQTKAVDEHDNVLSGTAAISYTKAQREAHAGPITPEKTAADIAAYQEAAFAEIDPDTVRNMTDAAVYSLIIDTYGTSGEAELYDPYWVALLSPWHILGEEPAQTAARVTDSMAENWYGAVAGMTQSALDQNQRGMWTFSDAERNYWTNMQASVAEPLSYGYSGGWENIIDCIAFLVFAILAACVTVAPVFSAEYQAGTDAVILSTRYGRTRLVAAKILASLLYATVLVAACFLVIAGFSLVFYGAGGFWLPIQNAALASPYALSVGEAALVAAGLMYLACLGFVALTLLLSSRTRSALAVFVADIVLLLITGLIPSAGVGVLDHALMVFPLTFSNLNSLFVALYSYPVGPFVFDLISVVAGLYLILTLTAIPLSAICFKNHQVA